MRPKLCLYIYIYMHACMCVRVCTYMHVYAYPHTYTYIHAYIHIHLHTHTHTTPIHATRTCAYICTCVHTQTCMHTALASTHAYKHTQAGMHALIALTQFLRTRFGMCIHVCVYACTFIQRYIFTFVFQADAQLRTHTWAPTPVYLDTHTHMQFGWASDTICWRADYGARRHNVRMRECVYDVFMWQPCRLICIQHVDTKFHAHVCLQRSCTLTKALFSSVHSMHVCTHTHAHTNKADTYLGLIPALSCIHVHVFCA